MYYMLLGTGFEETEAIAPLDLLRRAGIQVATVGINGKIVASSHKIGVEADLEIQELDLTTMEGIILPGGLGGVASIKACKAAMDAIAFAWDNGLLTAAICAAPTILSELGITDGRQVTCHPTCTGQMGTAHLVEEAAVIDGNLVTGTSAGCSIPFGLALIRAIQGADAAENMARQIVIR